MIGQYVIQYAAAYIWNDIPDSIKLINSLVQFKSIIRKHEKWKCIKSEQFHLALQILSVGF